MVIGGKTPKNYFSESTAQSYSANYNSAASKETMTETNEHLDKNAKFSSEKCICIKAFQ